MDGTSKYRLHSIEMPMEHRNGVAVPNGETETALLQRAEFEGLLADVSARLLNLPPEEVDTAILDALGRLAEHLGVDRASIATADPAQGLLATHSWARPEMSP